MANYEPSARAQKFKAWMQWRGWNTKRVAEASGVSYTTLASFVQGHTQSLRGDTEHKVAAALGTTAEDLFGGGGTIVRELGMALDADALPADLDQLEPFLADPRSGGTRTAGRLKPVQRRIPVVGEVAAGLWREQQAVELEQVDEWLPVEIPGYERAALYALKVTGSSMNAVYPPGRFVIVAPAHEAGVRWGDYVIVERQKNDLVETTIKELVNDRGRLALYPRSYDPNFQDPIYLKHDTDDQTAPRIIGVVVADFARRERPPA
jgi:phage repressor protein C with HTH and peptisase S24 domain